jgi:BMFP domain-containing protein YqiC
MDDQPFIDRIMAEVRQRVPLAGELADEAEHNLRAVLSEAIDRLDLISREEFDAQQRVLTRTRQRLEELEQEVAELERRLNDE